MVFDHVFTGTMYLKFKSGSSLSFKTKWIVKVPFNEFDKYPIIVKQYIIKFNLINK